MTRKALWRDLDEYFVALERSPLADKSREDYYYFAECFVRWLDGTFEPGANALGNRRAIIDLSSPNGTKG